MTAAVKRGVVPFPRPVASQAERNRSSAAWLRAQLDELQIYAASHAVTGDQLVRITGLISSGEDFRMGAWK